MKKILLSTLTVATLSTLANAMTLYTDSTTGQVFTSEGEGRDKLGEFVSTSKKASTPVFAKTSKLKFSGLHYLGYRYRSFADEFTQSNPTVPTTNESHFETRRNYIQVKAYFFNDPKSYMRMTLDTFEETHDPDDVGGSQKLDGAWLVRLKYAYIYLNEVLPYTGVEFGQAHRPWIDYEEHNSFFYRSVSKVLVETKNAADLTNSADIGINFKTKLPYYSSEVGIYNGEGYHSVELGSSVSAEWRFTGHLLGTGMNQKDKPTTKTYWDASFYGQYNMYNDKYNYQQPDGSRIGQSYAFYGLHTVFNMPSFLISAQYVKSDFDYSNTENTDQSWYKKNGAGYSVHAVGRAGENKQYEVFARYDLWEGKNANNAATDGALDTFTTNNYVYGMAWQENKNLKWLLSGTTYQALDNVNYKGKTINNFTDIMLTAEVKW